MRFIYTDEAGTSANEPLTIVVALVVHGDTQWMPAARKIEAALAKVPEKYRANFTFHAAAIWGSEKYREGWSRENRKALLVEMMAIPRLTDIAIAYGLYRRAGEIAHDLRGMSREQYQHANAFGVCMATADQYLRDYAGPDEIATVVAEDVPEMRRHLRESVTALRQGVVRISATKLWQVKRMGPRNTFDGEMLLRVTRIVDDVHFTPKDKAPLLQAADAVAFGLRRYFSRQAMGPEFADAILGPDGSSYPIEQEDCECGMFFMDEMRSVPPFSGNAQ